MKPTTSIPTRQIPVCAPRRSGLTNLQLALMGKGSAQKLRRPMTQAEADRWVARHGKADR